MVVKGEGKPKGFPYGKATLSTPLPSSLWAINNFFCFRYSGRILTAPIFSLFISLFYPHICMFQWSRIFQRSATEMANAEKILKCPLRYSKSEITEGKYYRRHLSSVIFVIFPVIDFPFAFVNFSLIPKCKITLTFKIMWYVDWVHRQLFGTDFSQVNTTFRT